MKTIVVHQQKGGVGKSMIAANIAFSLSELQKKICIIDAGMGRISLIYNSLIPRGLFHFMKSYKILFKNLLHSRLFNIVDTFHLDLTDALKHKNKLKKSIKKIKSNLYIIPSSFEKFNDYVNKDLKNNILVFRDLFEKLMEQGFDYLVVDLATGYSELRDTILPYSDEVIVPFNLDPSLSVGWSILKGLINNLNLGKKSKIIMDNIIINEIIRNDPISIQILNNIKVIIGRGKNIYEIDRDSIILKAEEYKFFIGELFPDSKAALIFNTIAKNII